MLKVPQKSHLRASSSDLNDIFHRQLIVGGQIATPGKYPYFVLINGDCGGSLIAPDIVLTAGHCKPRVTVRNKRGQQQVGRVRVGIYERQHSIATEEEGHPAPPLDLSKVEESFAVLDATRHVRFERLGGDEFRYDYSLIKLNGTSVHPHLELHRGALEDDDESLSSIQVTAMGMGDTDKHRPSRSNMLREVNLTVIPSSICEQTHGRGMSYQGRIGKSHLCTFAPHKDSCNYDSGSPIILFDENKQQNALVGMVSWGEECADKIFPAVNSRISVALDWIDDKVCGWSVNPPASFGCFNETTTIMPPSPPVVNPSSTATTNAGSSSWLNHQHLPKPGESDFVWVVLFCILAGGASRLWWGLRRRDCEYQQLK